MTLPEWETPSSRQCCRKDSNDEFITVTTNNIESGGVGWTDKFPRQMLQKWASVPRLLSGIVVIRLLLISQYSALYKWIYHIIYLNCGRKIWRYDWSWQPVIHTTWAVVKFAWKNPGLNFIQVLISQLLKLCYCHDQPGLQNSALCLVWNKLFLCFSSVTLVAMHNIIQVTIQTLHHVTPSLRHSDDNNNLHFSQGVQQHGCSENTKKETRNWKKDMENIGIHRVFKFTEDNVK